MSFAKRADQCRFCSSCTCFFRIVAIGFDEVACAAHATYLERFADAELPPGWNRLMDLSTSRQRRGERVGLDVWRARSLAPVEIAGREASTVTPTLTQEERNAMRHALGITQGPDGRDRFAHRNHFVTDEADPLWVGLQARGLAQPMAPSDWTPHRAWSVTVEGRILVGAQLT